MNAHRGRVLILGAGGQVGQALLAAVGSVDFQLEGRTRSEADITDPASLRHAFESVRPHVVINAAAYTDVNGAETDRAGAEAVNAKAAEAVALACRTQSAALVHISTDYVFAGDRTAPYTEADAGAPVNAYGQTKLAGETAIQSTLKEHVILRTSCVLSAHGTNFLRRLFQKAQTEKDIPLVSDQITSPTPANMLAAALLIIAGQIVNGKRDGFGVFHYAGQPPSSYYGLARAAFEAARPLGFIHPPILSPAVLKDFPQMASRPAHTVLACDKIREVYGVRPPDWRRALPQILQPLVGLSLLTRRAASASS